VSVVEIRDLEVDILNRRVAREPVWISTCLRTGQNPQKTTANKKSEKEGGAVNYRALPAHYLQ
jgi:hypothetical protein